MLLTVTSALLWGALTRVRGGVSTGVSKRAVLFGALVYAGIVFAAASTPMRAGRNGNQWWVASVGSLHGLGACAVALAAVWVVIKASGLAEYARASAVVIVLLTMLSFVLGILTALSAKPSWSELHQLVATMLLLAAVWHAYEMRIYPID